MIIGQSVDQLLEPIPGREIQQRWIPILVPAQLLKPRIGFRLQGARTRLAGFREQAASRIGTELDLQANIVRWRFVHQQLDDERSELKNDRKHTTDSGHHTHLVHQFLAGLVNRRRKPRAELIEQLVNRNRLNLSYLS